VVVSENFVPEDCVFRIEKSSSSGWRILTHTRNGAWTIKEGEMGYKSVSIIKTNAPNK